MRKLKARTAVALIAVLALAAGSVAQEAARDSLTPKEQGMNEAAKTRTIETNSSADGLLRHRKEGASQLFRDFVDDQRVLWTSPARLRFADANWLVPLSGVTAGLFVTDASFSRHLSHNPQTLSHYSALSNAGVAALVGGAGGMWLMSHYHRDDHWRETGFLAGEAAVSSLTMIEALKYSLRRDRPLQGDGSGAFFQSGGTSFPSEHSAVAWSVASIVAHEYPGPLTKIFAYGTASLVSYSRVRAEKHFPSDVVVGALLGELAAREIYKRRHDPELGGDVWGDPADLFLDEGRPRPGFIGSPYVPLDSWVYPALDRLAAMGLVDSSFAGMRPWTRLECARLVSEARSREDESDGAGSSSLNELEREFQPELEGGAGRGETTARIESVYTRLTGISGAPLTDNYHFGQTILNDYGRPEQEGLNSLLGMSGWAAAGPFVIYVRAEYQHSPSAQPLSLAARSFISAADVLPSIGPAEPIPTIDRLKLLDAYAGMNFNDWQLTFGKQSLWWGPSEGGPFLFSDNAEPIPMFRISRVTPFQLPWVFSYLGKIRAEFFVGQLSGQEFVVDPTGTIGQFGQTLSPQPFINGQKISFKFTPNFEFSISKTALFAGEGLPFTGHTFLRSVFSPGNAVPGTINDPGDRRTAVDFSYRIPKLRKWLTFYGDAFNEDEISPLAYPRKAAFQGGLYFSRVPGIPKLDLRLEGGSTSPPNFPECNGCFYSNGRYVNGYTNNSQLMGAWFGRAAQGETISSNYWFNGRNKIGVQLRHRKIDGQFLPQGGTQNDTNVKFDLFFRPQMSVSGLVQYEKWNIPLLAPGPQSNVTASVTFTYWPAPKNKAAVKN